MLDINDYIKINQFKDELHKFFFYDPEYNAFRKRCSVLLEKFFGFGYSIFGYGDKSTKKQITLTAATYNIKFEHLARLLSEENRRRLELIQEDTFVISSHREYQYLFQNALADCEFGDMMVQYLKVENVYVGYLLLFTPKRKGCFTGKDREIIAAIANYISVEYNNYSELSGLVNFNNLLLTQSNFYPIGLIILKNTHEFHYANEYAKNLISELGLSSCKFFPIFFTTHLLPKIRYSLSTFGNGQRVVYKNYHFNIVSTTPFSTNHHTSLVDAQSRRHVSRIQDYATDNLMFIYCCKDDSGMFGASAAAAGEYHYSDREREIVELILKGMKRQQIAKELSISINTVNSHLQNIYKKTGTSSMLELVSKLNQGR